MPIQTLYQKLLDEKIVGSEGQTMFSMQGIEIQVQDISIVGNIIQEWLEHFMLNHSISYRKKSNSQEFPDFMLGSDDRFDLLEVKSFTGSPNFDIANFQAYARSLRENAYRLDAKYLLFRYSKCGEGIIIDNIWLKNVWEICSKSDRSEVKIQWKQGTPVNIRLSTWYSSKTKYPSFTSRVEFVTALSKVIGMAGIDQSIQKNWLKAVKENYFNTTGKEL